MTRDNLHATMEALLPVGRANAISVAQLGELLGSKSIHYLLEGSRPASSTVRRLIHAAQEAGVQVLSSPRVGVWMAAGDAEVLELVEELRETVRALERRMQVINGGRCALITCRAELSGKIKRRGGLYCMPGHRYQAAVLRGSS